DGKNARQLLMQHVKGTPDLSPLPPRDREIIGRALSKTPSERFPSCGELIRALRKAPTVAVAPHPALPAAGAAHSQQTPAYTPASSQPPAPAASGKPAKRDKHYTLPEVDLYAAAPAPSKGTLPKSKGDKGDKDDKGDTVEIVKNADTHHDKVKNKVED